MINWLYLFLAGVCEIGWPVGLKLAATNRWWALFAIATMAASGLLLFLAQKGIPMGTAYAVWTGIGAVGAFVVGILWFEDPATAARMIAVGFIVIGIVGLKLAA
ncbi:MAG: ligand-binding protein [Gammaproteobacteria bacterium]|jgi:quaternary ammonium compound-resistance protein SugE|nr:ligand-binding protein [Gammaproteobacteria bacterium]